MRRLIFSAFLLSTALAVGCGDDSGTGDTDGGGGLVRLPDGGYAKPDSGTKKPDGGSTPIGKTDGGGMVNFNVQGNQAPPFIKDATGAAGLPADTINKLKAGGSCTANILYPYDGTLFPAGLVPPTIMWDGPTDGAYIHFAFPTVMTKDGMAILDYSAAAPAGSAGELDLDPDDWNQIVQRTVAGAQLEVTLNTMTGGQVSSCVQHWTIAPGVMSGSIFFNTYNHPDKLGNGAVVRLKLGESQSEIYLSYQGLPSIAGPCISCHSVSFDGSMMAASLHNYTPVMTSYTASSYPVQDMVEPMPVTDLPDSTFGAMTPDGKFLLSMGNPECSNGANAFPRAPNNFPLVPGPSVATLHDTTTGQAVNAPGLNPGYYMWMPQFSPKGDKVAFNHAKMGADGKTDRRELAVMDYDATTHTFSNLQVLVSNDGPAPSIDYNPLPTLSPGANSGVNNCTPSGDDPNGVGFIPGGSCTGPCYPAWPFFTPEGDALVYTMISEPDFASAIPGRDTASKSEVWYIDIASKKKVLLKTAMTGTMADDPQANYYPTMLPVQVGGYYWLFWTSTRAWGHKDLSPTPEQVGANWFGGASVLNATKKRIWVSAIKPRATTEAGQADLSDTSSPAFYLEGQTASGNVRAFATLNPCHQDGGECSSGLDCCSGYCDIKDGQTMGTCVPQKMCSDTNEKCKEDKDCCPPSNPSQPANVCIGQYCGTIAL